MLHFVSHIFWNRAVHKYSETLESRAEYLAGLFNVHSNMGYYLDIGSGHGEDACTIGKECGQIVVLDIDFRNLLKNSDAKHKGLVMIRADGRKLPFKTGSFQMVSLFSVLEHIPEKRHTLSEAFRVLSREGVMLIQIPNRYFPIELHSGLPMINYLPNMVVRKKLLRALGASEWLLTVDTPSLKGLIKLIKRASPNSHIVSARKIVFPTNMLLPGFQRISAALSRIGFFNVFPYGYCITVEVQ